MMTEKQQQAAAAYAEEQPLLPLGGEVEGWFVR